MKKGLSLKTALTALAASFVWGTAFAFQRMAAGHIGAITFNFYRSVLAALALGVLLFVSNRRRRPEERKKSALKKIAAGGIVCGVLVAVASVLQQCAIAEVEAGKAGFLTTLYILLVPLFSVLFLHKKVAPNLWVSVALGLTGLYFISVKDGFTISPSDAMVLLSAVIYAAYILAADYFVRFCSPTELNCAQFIVASVVCLIGMFAVEEPTLAELRDNIIPILYLGIFSSAVAYTLQIIGQKYADMTTATLTMSLESVFAAIAGWLILKETMGVREIIGCVLIFAAIVVSQLKPGKKAGAQELLLRRKR